MSKINSPLFAELVAGATAAASSHMKLDDGAKGDMFEPLATILNLVICILLLIILALNWDNED